MKKIVLTVDEATNRQYYDISGMTKVETIAILLTAVAATITECLKVERMPETAKKAVAKQFCKLLETVILDEMSDSDTVAFHGKEADFMKALIVGNESSKPANP